MNQDQLDILVMLLLWFIGSCIILSAICIPDFVKQMPQEKREEYEALYDQQKELTRTGFYDLCQNWAEKQGAKTKKKYRQFRRDEERYIEKRDRVLRARLDAAEGSAAAKKFLHELLDLQHNMDIPLGLYEAREEEMRHEIPADVLAEATKLWNLLDPAHID